MEIGRDPSKCSCFLTQTAESLGGTPQSHVKTGDLVIYDNGSSNGTYVNGARIQRNTASIPAIWCTLGIQQFSSQVKGYWVWGRESLPLTFEPVDL